MPTYNSEHILSLAYQVFKPKIRDINLSKMAANPPTLTREQLTAMEDSATYQKIMQMFEWGDLTRARELTIALDNTYYTEAEKDEIIAVIDIYLPAP